MRWPARHRIEAYDLLPGIMAGSLVYTVGLWASDHLGFALSLLSGLAGVVAAVTYKHSRFSHTQREWLQFAVATVSLEVLSALMQMRFGGIPELAATLFLVTIVGLWSGWILRSSPATNGASP
jgi:hypothetical protein